MKSYGCTLPYYNVQTNAQIRARIVMAKAYTEVHWLYMATHPGTR